MSDASNNIDALDPQRPWITDARQLPSRMNWLDAMFNPTGKSPKLHFTRVWTVCFFLQLLIVVVPFGVGIVASLAGGDPKPIQTFGVYATPIVFIVTTYISFVAHSRRLNDAGKTSILAVLVLLPLLAGMALSFMGIMKSAEAYDNLYAERAIYLENPDAWRAEQLEKRQAAQAAAEAARADAAQADEAGEGEAKPEQRGPQRGAGGPRADQPLPSQLAFIIKPNLMIIQMILVGFNVFLALWSLLWLARVPDFGKSESDASLSYT